jgi:3-oxoacyl-[acyl-carrier protein] reductase
MFTPITGRSVVVTGGSRGIGRGIARVFAAAGARVMVVARDREAAEAAVAEIRDRGGDASYLLADLADPVSADRLVGAAVERHGRLDVLCCNAGIYPASPLREVTAEEIDQVLAVNLRSMMLSVRACLPHMERAGGGRVILTSSITGPITGYPGWSHYGASKAAQLGFMRTAAIELARARVTINAVLPGNIVTEGLEDLGEEYLRRMEGSIPLGRLGSVEDVAHAALFLASDEAGYITGQTIVVDGGQTLPESLMALEEG